MKPSKKACLRPGGQVSADRYLLKMPNLVFRENKQRRESDALDTIPDNLHNLLIVNQ
jgi:hypothetical protein